MPSSAGEAAVKVAGAIAVVAVLLMSSSQGHGHGHGGHHKTRRPLCSNCTSLCNSYCAGVVATNCSVPCNQSPGPDCGRCTSEVLQGCQTCCGNSSRGSEASCCGNGCVGDCGACGCDCSSIVGGRCGLACRPEHSIAECWACQNAVGSQCVTSCNTTCHQNCVNKGGEGCSTGQA